MKNERSLLSPSVVNEYLLHGHIYNKTHIDETEKSVQKYTCLNNSIKKDVTKKEYFDSPGLLLSSGLDSSMIALLTPVPIKTYTINFSKREWNEDSIAHRVAAAAGHKHVDLVYDSDDLIGNLERWVRLLELPYSHPNGLPTFLAIEEIKKDCDILIDGTGGDVLFGYLGQNIKLKTRHIIKNKIKELLKYIISPVINGKYIPINERKVFFENWKGKSRFLIAPNIYSNESRDFIKSYVDKLSGYNDEDFYKYYILWSVAASSGRIRMMSDILDVKLLVPFMDDSFIANCGEIPVYARKKEMQLEIVRDFISDYTYKKLAMQTPWDETLKSYDWNKGMELIRNNLVSFNHDFFEKIVDLHMSDQEKHGQKLLNALILALWCNSKGIKI
ncbi:MAG: asparagine synthase C-terminal domain-containing protein [Candidatus Thiodiazotropha sp.]